ncbi:hypothetical protein ABVK25_002010 [Lepraria finkii]|uniref:NADH dehydrogenase [ubiquinone] 1 alpha subcomplex subunit 13 n=1 Tax=Lepraria finkii TaxID=1340010 RepID=A0ABR4BIH1_9LECA
MEHSAIFRQALRPPPSPIHTSLTTVSTMAQALPPTGGYEPIQYKRNIPARGFRPSYYLAAMGIIMTYGLYRAGQGIREHNELAREKMWSRIHLIPMLQAEEDRDLVRRQWADKVRERELTGGEAKVYNSDRFVRPTYSISPSKTTKE